MVWLTEAFFGTGYSKKIRPIYWMNLKREREGEKKREMALGQKDQVFFLSGVGWL